MIKRDIHQNVLNMLNESAIVYINGARQFGKSTLALQIATELNMEYITFDDTTMYLAAKNDPSAFIKHIKTNVVIDEVQMVPEIFRELKQYIDEIKLLKKNSKILLTGSANITILPKLSDALVGRMRIITLYPFSHAEYIQVQSNFIDQLFSCNFKLQKNAAHDDDVTDIIKKATFPEVSLASQLNTDRWFESYLMTLLRRDIKDLANVEKMSDIPIMLKILAARVGSLINESSLARDCNINLMTLRRYRALLENMFLMFRVYPWFRNISKRLVKANKNYFVDTYMLCHLLGIDINLVRQNNQMLFGHILENYVATELVKALSKMIGISLFHLRALNGSEVDFVLEKKNGDLVGIEVKSKLTISAHDFKGLKILSELATSSFKCGVVLYPGTDIVPFADNMFAIPIMLL